MEPNRETRNRHRLEQGSPTPGPWTGTCPWAVRNRATQQELSGRRASEASSAAPHRSHYHLNHSPCPLPPLSVEKLSSKEPVLGAKKGWGLLDYSISQQLAKDGLPNESFKNKILYWQRRSKISTSIHH